MSQFTIVLGNPPALDAEGRRVRARRARELLDGASWLFDEFMSEETRALLDANDTAEREEHHRNIRVAADLKGRLMQIVQTQEAEDTINGRKHRDDPGTDRD